MGSKLAWVLDKIKGQVKHLEFIMDPNENSSFEDGRSSKDVEFPRLRSLNWNANYLHDSQSDFVQTMGNTNTIVESVIRNTALFLEILNRSTNLEELTICPWHGPNVDDGPRVFYRLLLKPPEYLGCNNLNSYGGQKWKETLKSLTMTSLSNDDFEALRQLNLKLTILNVSVDHPLLTDEEHFSALSSWLTELSPTLERLSLNLGAVKYACRNYFRMEFPVEMKKLKYLHLDEPNKFGVDRIIPLLKGLPKLESLTLIDGFSTGLNLEEFSNGALEDISFPNLKYFMIGPKYFWESDCQPSSYVPKLFPNLKQLSISVYSKNTFLSCVYQLKEMMIEELALLLEEPSPEGIETDGITEVPWAEEAEMPSLNSWKRLRKLTLKPYPATSARDVFGIPMERVLPECLTSLKIPFFTSVKAGFLINILGGLSRLLELKVLGMYIFDPDRKGMKQSDFVAIIRKNPSIHPYLQIYTDATTISLFPDTEITEQEGPVIISLPESPDRSSPVKNTTDDQPVIDA